MENKEIGYSMIEYIEDGLNCIALFIYNKPYKECNSGEKVNIASKNNSKFWIELNRDELLKFSILNK